MKLDSIQRKQKLIVENLPIVNIEERENVVDIFQDLPLRNENDLQAMEAKLIADDVYRRQMVSV